MNKRWNGITLAALFAISLTAGLRSDACVVPMATTSTAMSYSIGVPASMADMRMGDAKAGNGESTTPKPLPCDSPKSPIGCAAAAGCASIGLVARLPERMFLKRIVFTLAYVDAIQPPSRTTRPELRPPRV